MELYTHVLFFLTVHVYSIFFCSVQKCINVYIFKEIRGLVLRDKGRERERVVGVGRRYSTTSPKFHYI